MSLFRRQAKAKASKPHAVQHSSRSVEHYGPAWLGDMAYVVMGGIDLDPATCDVANTLIRARAWHTAENGNDGLTAAWWGRVYLNPPGGERVGPDGKLCNQQALWYARLAASWETGEIEQAFFVVFNLELFRYAQRYPVKHPLDPAFLTCWPRDRIKFDRPATAAERAAGIGPTVEQTSPGHPNCIVYMPPAPMAGDGRERERFVDCGGAIGYVPRTWDIPF